MAELPVTYLLTFSESEVPNEIDSEWHELIRCKDCKYYDGYFCHNELWGDGHGYYTPPIKQEDGYCDWSERKEE